MRAGSGFSFCKTLTLNASTFYPSPKIGKFAMNFTYTRSLFYTGEKMNVPYTNTPETPDNGRRLISSAPPSRNRMLVNACICVHRDYKNADASGETIYVFFFSFGCFILSFFFLPRSWKTESFRPDVRWEFDTSEKFSRPGFGGVGEMVVVSPSANLRRRHWIPPSFFRRTIMRKANVKRTGG